MNKKIECLRNQLKEENIDGIIIKNPLNVRYLTGLNVEGYLIINDNENYFITDSRYTEVVNNSLTIEDEIISENIADLSEEDYLSFFQNCERVGFEEQFITYYQYNEMIRRFRIKEAVETDNIIEKMRTIKDEEEISCIEKACNITDECFLHLQKFIKAGMTEKEVAWEIYNFFMSHGAEGLAFDTIVASGSNTSMPHAVPTDKQIKYGDPILIDFGAKYNGYCADMTRMLFIGEVSEEVKKLYEMVLNEQTDSLEKMKIEADGNIISKTVQNNFKANGFDLVHALGHGVGLYIHESPVLSTRRSTILKKNMVITDEPGIYVPGEIGIRIEDTVLIGEEGPVSLTKSNKNLLVI